MTRADQLALPGPARTLSRMSTAVSPANFTEAEIGNSTCRSRTVNTETIDHLPPSPFSTRAMLVAVVALLAAEPALLQPAPSSLERGVFQHGDELGLDVGVALSQCRLRGGEQAGKSATMQWRHGTAILMTASRSFGNE